MWFNIAILTTQQAVYVSINKAVNKLILKKHELTMMQCSQCRFNTDSSLSCPLGSLGINRMGSINMVDEAMRSWELVHC